jgi:ABC-type bacteriocin/lantibiotic exporter with double-glycine peptidase domain
LKRRWQEFRWGHSVYLVFALSFLNFLLITYRLLIEHVPFLESLFPNLTTYAAIALTVYVPIAVLVGHFHRKRQLRTDIVLQAEQNPYLLEILERLKRIEEKLENA